MKEPPVQQELTGQPSHEATTLASRNGRRIVTLALFVAGVLLLAAAVTSIIVNRDQLGFAWASMSRASPLLFLAVLLSPVVNIVLTGVSFAILTRRRGHVEHREMIGLIWVASVLNQLPLRPGMFGRIAYHRAVNQISVSDSIRVIVEVLLCAVAANVLLLGVLLVAAVADWSGAELAGVVLGLISATVAVALISRLVWRHGGRYREHVWRYPAVLAVRLGDMCVWAARYVLVFHLIGVSIDARGGAALACAGQAAMMTPVPMGLREWVIGATAAWLPNEFVDARKFDREDTTVISRSTPGLMADVINRSAELSVGVPGALIAGVWLGRRARRRGESISARTAT